MVVLGSPRFQVRQFSQRGAHNQRRYQQRIGIEGEADGGYDADHPLHRGEAVRRRRRGLRLGHGLERNKFTSVLA